MTLQQFMINSDLTILTHSKDVDQVLSLARGSTKFIYFARHGNTFNGHTLALKIIRSQNYCVGQKNQILQSSYTPQEQSEILNSKFFISVDDVELELKQALKENFYSLNYRPFSVGVTGTSGKTSIVQIAGQLFNLLNQSKTLKIGTLGIEIGNEVLDNSHQTTPDYPAFIHALKKAKNKDLTHLIMEVSSHGLAENRLHDYKFDVAVFTNFSQDHLDFHQSLEEYFKAKTLLFSKHLKTDGACIISTQSNEWLQILEAGAHSDRTLYLLLNEKHLEYCLKAQPFVSHFKNAYFLVLSNSQSTLSGLSGTFKLLDKNQNLISSHAFHCPLLGDINFENLMATFCIQHAAGFDSAVFLPLFQNIQSIPGRMQALVSNANCTSEKPFVIIDYSHKPGALQSVLQTLRSLASPEQKIISVFGCGGDRDTSKRSLMGTISAQLADVTILTSDNPRSEDPQKIINDIRIGVPNTSCCYEEPDRKFAIQKAFKIAKKSDIILIAGKGHETIQIIGNQKIEFSDAQIARSFLQ